MKKVSLNFVFVILIISFVGSILFGALVRLHYKGGNKFKNLQKVAVFFAEIPRNIKFIITNKNDDSKNIFVLASKNKKKGATAKKPTKNLAELKVNGPILSMPVS